MMRTRVASRDGRPAGRLITAGLLALLASACSSDAFRLADNPFSNPFAQRVDASPTGSIPAKAVPPSDLPPAPPPSAPVVSRPLPPPSAPFAGARPPSLPSASVPKALGATTGAAKGWTGEGGARVVAGAGDSVDALSNRYGVPAAAIREVNGIPPGGSITPGQSITIPTFRPDGAKRAEAPAPKVEKPMPPKPVEAKAPSKKPETKPVAAKKEEPRKTEVKKAEVKKEEPKKVETKKPEVKKVETKKEEPKKVETKVVKVETKPVKPEVKKVEPKVEPKPVAKVEPPAPPPVKVAAKPATPPAPAPAKPPVDPDITGAVKPSVKKEPPKAEEPPVTQAAKDPEFRWPTKGRIIKGYGTSGNDGINIAVPEGTPVHAAEEGVVAYAGDELKGYGKLVLIKHGNGWVSAYAHNGELMVKKGEKVRRGQPVAKAGQTGDVASPQVHFELRKGATPVDPAGFLPK